MITTVDALFGLAFLSQIVVLSLLWPSVLARRLGAPGASHAQQHMGRTSSDRRLQVYASANRALVALGVVVLALLFTLDVFQSLEAMLLAIGLYFFLQLSSLALVKDRLPVSPGAVTGPQDTEGPRGPIRLSDLVSPVPVGIACALLLAYGVAQLSLAGGVWGPEMLKAGILTGANAFFVLLLAWNLYRVRRTEPAARVERLQELRKAAPMLAYISIGLSVYFFGKDVIAVIGVPRLRLLMMSLFLQMLASLAYSRLLAR